MRKWTVHNDSLFVFPRWKLILGISIALLTSFCWYAFFYVVRELMRISFYWVASHSSGFELLILTDKEVLFYNFVFALIASVFGLSACFQFWFHRAKGYNENSIGFFRKSSIFTDVTGLNAIFLYWFANVSFAFAVFGGILHAWCYFQLYPGWIFFWVYIIVVLFMEMWKTIRKVAFRESRRWILFSTIGIVVWSFLLSRIQFIDYKEINNVCLNSSVTRKYQIEYPESDYFRKTENRSLVVDIHLCFPIGVKMDSLPKVFVNQKESGFDHFHEKIDEEFQKRNEKDHRLITAVLHIDKQMPMKYVKILQEYLTCNEIKKIGYRVFPAGQGVCARTTSYTILRQLPPCSNPEISPEILQWNNTEDYELLPVRLTPSGLYINGLLQNRHNMEFYIQKFVIDHSNYLIVLEIEDDCLYDDYIKAFSTIFNTFSNLRDDASLQNYAKLFDDLTSEQQEEILKRYRVMIYEPKPVSADGTAFVGE